MSGRAEARYPVRADGSAHRTC